MFGVVVATADGLTARARVRVVPKLPYTQDFEKVPEGRTPAGWVNSQGKFVVEKRDDVLMVPNRAVRQQGNQKTVTVVYRGEQIAVSVGTGLSNDQFVEITNGLKEGDAVMIQTTQTRAGNVPGIPGAGTQMIIPAGR